MIALFPVLDSMQILFHREEGGGDGTGKGAALNLVQRGAGIEITEMNQSFRLIEGQGKIFRNGVIANRQGIASLPLENIAVSIIGMCGIVV